MIDEYYKQIWELYEQEMAKRNSDDYEANPEQMRKFINAYGFFSDLVKKNGGSIEPIRLAPTEVNGGITAYFTVFYLAGEEVARFSEVIKGASALSIDSLEDGTVCISFTVPKVFRHK